MLSSADTSLACLSAHFEGPCVTLYEGYQLSDSTGTKTHFQNICPLVYFQLWLANRMFSLLWFSEKKSQRRHTLSRQLQVSAPSSKRDPTSGPGEASGSGSSASPVGNTLCAHGYWSKRASVLAGFLGDLCTQAWVAPLPVVLGTAAGLCRSLSLSSSLWNWVIPRNLRFLPNVPPTSHSWPCSFPLSM